MNSIARLLAVLVILCFVSTIGYSQTTDAIGDKLSKLIQETLAFENPAIIIAGIRSGEETDFLKLHAKFVIEDGFLKVTRDEEQSDHHIETKTIFIPLNSINLIFQEIDLPEKEASLGIRVN